MKSERERHGSLPSLFDCWRRNENVRGPSRVCRPYTTPHRPYGARGKRRIRSCCDQFLPIMRSRRALPSLKTCRACAHAPRVPESWDKFLSAPSMEERAPVNELASVARGKSFSTRTPVNEAWASLPDAIRSECAFFEQPQARRHSTSARRGLAKRLVIGAMPCHEPRLTSSLKRLVVTGTARWRRGCGTTGSL